MRKFPKFKNVVIVRTVSVNPHFGDYRLHFITLTDHYLCVGYTRDLENKDILLYKPTWTFLSPCLTNVQDQIVI